MAGLHKLYQYYNVPHTPLCLDLKTEPAGSVQPGPPRWTGANCSSGLHGGVPLMHSSAGLGWGVVGCISLILSPNINP